MPFQIVHKCQIDNFEPDGFGMFAVSDEFGRPVTKIECPRCRERMIMMGHELFMEAERTQSSNLPPGFVIAKVRTQG